MKRLNLRTKKTNGVQKTDLNKKKSMDYTEMAYREAVSKLKYLLAESYISKPIIGKSPGINDIYQIDNAKINEDKVGIEADDRSVILDHSKAQDLHDNLNTLVNPQFASCKSIYPSKTCSNLTFSTAVLQSVPPELNSFIEQQEDYIHQLEQESQFCRNQLTNLLHKVREVVAENDALHYRTKAGLFKCALDEYARTEDDREYCKLKPVQTEIAEIKKPKILEGPSVVFESRISELEAQLTQAKLELRKAQEENQINVKRLSESCLNTDISEIKVHLEKALRGKCEAEMKIEELEKSVIFLRNKETEAVEKAKQSTDAIQQIEFEKKQCETEVKRLREELDKQHEKLRDATQEANRRITEERQQAECRYNKQVEQLSADIASHWDAASKSQLESEKQRRELTEFKRELLQKQSLIDNLKKELQNKISSLQSELNQALTEKDNAEQDILSMKLAAERSERQSRQEQSRLQIEINSYKQRLERADADLAYCRRENSRLSEQIASLEKEINKNKSVRSEDPCEQVLPKSESEKELTSMIMDMESKHAATVAGLEDALNNQAMLVSQLTAECQSLTQRLEANSLKHKEEMATLQYNIGYLSDQIKSTISNQKAISLVETKDIAHQEQNMKINNSSKGNSKPIEENDSFCERDHEIENNVLNDFSKEVNQYEYNINEDNEQTM